MGKEVKRGGEGTAGPAVPLSVERANFVVDAAAKEADDVVASMHTDGKKPRSLKAATKDAVKELVQSGDPTKVLMYIKGHKKEFISGMYSTVFMSAIRKKMGGDDTPPAAPPGAATPKPEAGQKEGGEDRDHKRAKLSHPSDSKEGKEGGAGGTAAGSAIKVEKDAGDRTGAGGDEAKAPES